MTQEEKARAYDEALKRAEAAINIAADKDLVKGVATTIFPELCESEDERIRKFLVKHVSEWIGCIEHDLKLSSKDVESEEELAMFKAGLAYLEKQKEQKPAESISQLTVQGKGIYKICPRCKSRMIRDDSKVYTSMPPQYGYECPKCGEMEFDTVKYDNPEMEEQKLADDKAFEEWIDDWWKHNKVNNPDSYDKGDEIQFDEQGFKNFCRGIRNMYQQQPAEWSEEEIVNWAYDNFRVSSFDMTKIVTKFSSMDELERSLREKLKSLRPQPKQEWSKGDEENFKWFDKFFRAESVIAGGRDIPQDKYLWFKSLRPDSYKNCNSRWKPSEEQMEWLESAVKLSTDKPHIHGIIISLYEQLKRL